MIAFQWQWRFDYPEVGVEVVGTRDRPAVLVVPVGEPVHVRLTSADVQHGFFIPRFLYKRDAIPGRINDFDLTITETGTFQGEVDASPMVRMRPPIVPEQPVPIVPEDGLRRLLAACGSKHFDGRRDTAIVMFLLDTGARRAELVGLRLADLDLDLDVAVVVGWDHQHAAPTGRCSGCPSARGGRRHRRGRRPVRGRRGRPGQGDPLGRPACRLHRLAAAHDRDPDRGQAGGEGESGAAGGHGYPHGRGM